MNCSSIRRTAAVLLLAVALVGARRGEVGADGHQDGDAGPGGVVVVPRSPGDGRGVEEGVRRGGHAAHLPGRRRRGRGRGDPEDAGRPDPGGRHHRHRAGVPRALLLRAAHPDDVRIRRGVRFRPGPVRAGPRAEDGGEGLRRPELGRRGVGPLLFEDARGHARGGQGAQALPVVGGHEPGAAVQGDGISPRSPFHERPPPRASRRGW